MKRFGLAKESIFRAFGLIQNQLSQAQELLESAHGPNSNGRMSLLLEKTKGIEDILARDHMKVSLIILLVIKIKINTRLLFLDVPVMERVLWLMLYYMTRFYQLVLDIQQIVFVL